MLLAPLLSPGFAEEPVHLSFIADAYSRADYNQTQSLILKSLSEKPASALRTKLLLLLASAYADGSEPEQANVVLRGLRALEPGQEKNETFNLIEAKAEEKSANVDKALLRLQGLELDRALFKTGCLLESQGQSYAAILKFQQLIKSFPQSSLIPATRLGLANSYLTLREYDQARKQLDDLQDLPQGLNVLKPFLAGSIAFQTKDFETARRSFSSIDDKALPDVLASARLLEGLSALQGGDVSNGERILNALLQSHETDAAFQASFQLVKHHLIAGQPDKAVLVCNAALPMLATAPRKSEILLLRAISYEKAGQTDQALTDFQEVVSLGEKETAPKALILMAHTLWIERKLDRLTSDFAEVLKTYRTQTNSKGKNAGLELEACDFLIGEAHLTWRRYAEAEKIFNQLLLKPLSPSLSAKVTGGLVAALIAQQKFGEAQKRLEELMVRFGEDRPVLKFGLLAQAHLLWNKGDYAEAAASYLKYAEMFPEDEDTPLASYMVGRCREKTNQPQEAFKAWDEVAKRYPASSYSARALVRSAALADRLGDKERAQLYYEKMAKGGNAQIVELALLQIGLTRLKSDQDTEAIKTLSQFVERYPSSSHLSEAARGLKEAYQQISYTEPARLPQLAEQYAANPYTGEAHYWMGMKEKDPAKALVHFQKVLKDYPRTPSFPRALFYKGQAELDLKDYKQALVTLGEFAKESPDHDLALIARYQRAGALAKAGFPEEACLAYEWVTKEAPYSGYASEAYLRWAQVLHIKGDYDAEVHVYESFLKDFPTDKKANEVYWRLGHLKRRAGAYQLAMTYYRKVVPTEGVATQQEVDEAIKSLEKIVSKGEPHP